MSAVPRALNLELPKTWADIQHASTSVNRWGAPIWKEEEPVVSRESRWTDALPLEITLLAFLYSDR